jgi:hypothetical protein
MSSSAAIPFSSEPGAFYRAEDGEMREAERDAAEEYRFKAAILTTGEATDGDRIDIKTLDIADMPFFAQHAADAVYQLGSFINGHRKTIPGGVEAIWTGRIDLGGVGALRDIRQDVAYRMSTGELNRFSGRWGPRMDGKTKRVRRTTLSKDHWAFVDSAKVGRDDPRGYGDLWTHAEGREGSIVGLGADPTATGREVSDAVRGFCERISEAEKLEARYSIARDATPVDMLRLAWTAALDDSDEAALLEALGLSLRASGDPEQPAWALRILEGQDDILSALDIDNSSAHEAIELDGGRTGEVLTMEQLLERRTRKSDAGTTPATAAQLLGRAEARRLAGKPTE